MEPASQPALAAALNRLWTQFQPQIEQKVAALEAAATGLAAGTLTIAERKQAGSAAHKLAGVLGTFGLATGTILAREAEVFYSRDLQNNPAAAVRLNEIAVQLRAMVASRE
jgi:HPt (histidine-containing phosphotransfer) domain-containing protein